MAPERASRLAAVLFTDLVGSTGMMQALGDRAFDDLRAEHFSRLAEAVATHHGEVVKNTGDGVLATFASVVDALGGTVALQQATQRQALAAAAPLALRVGLSAGEMTFEDGDVFGTPVVEAARLVALAGSGQTLCHALVRTLAGGRAEVGLTDAGVFELKGLAEPVAACEVTWEPLAAGLPLPALLRSPGRIFVGREAPLERCLATWNQAVAGQCRVSLLAGEPGVGKTRLAIEVAAVVSAEGGVVLAGRCDEDLGVPYQPFVEALRHYVTEAPELRLGRHGVELVRLVPELGDRLPGAGEPLRSDPEMERYRLFEAITLWLADLSAEVPVLLVLDDLHWAAKPTLLLLRHILRSPAPLRLMVLVTYRDTDVGRGHPLGELLADLRRDGDHDRLSVTGLDRAAVGAYIEAATGSSGSDDEHGALAGAVWEETEGNAFFVSEVVRHLTESGAVAERDGRLVVTAPLDELGIPEGVRDVVGRRLSRLSETANRVLAVAAVIGPEFDLAVVEAAGSFEQEDVYAAIEEADTARLVLDAPGPVPRSRFAHALVRATLYEEVSAGRRVALHRRVAAAIETVHAARLDDYLPALAYHSARGGAEDQAVDYSIRAGDRALGQLAHHEAAGYYHQAIELLDGPRDPRRLGLLVALGEAQRRAGDPAHRATLLEAGQLAHANRDTALQVQAALANQRGLFSRMGAVDQERVEALVEALAAVGSEESPERARLLAALAAELHYSDDDRPLELGHQALALARQVAEPAALAEVLAAVWFATRAVGTPGERSRLAAELSQLAATLGDPSVEFQAGVAVYLTACEQADMERARPALATVRRLAEDLGQPVLRWRANCLAATFAMATDDLAAAEGFADESLRIGESAGQADAEAFALSTRCVLRYLQGRSDEAVPIVRHLIERFPGARGFRPALAWFLAETGQHDEAAEEIDKARGRSFADIPRQYNWIGTISMLSRAVAGVGHHDSAAELYDLLFPHRDIIVMGQSVWFGPVAHDLGLLATTLGRDDDADRHFAAAAELEVRTGAHSMLAHTRAAWGRP